LADLGGDCDGRFRLRSPIDRPKTSELISPQDDKDVTLMRIENSIRKKLAQAFAPAQLRVVNVSHDHAGHHSSPGTGESHFSVMVVSVAFAGKSRIERHRMVNAALAEELSGHVHALAVSALTPEESAKSS